MLAGDQEPLEYTTVHLLGLPEHCWRCGAPSTALVGMMAEGGDLFSEDLVLCDDDGRLAFAWGYLPEDAKLRAGVGEVAVRYSKTTGSSYLSNGCVACGALFGWFPLFGEGVPEALAEAGAEAFVTLARVHIPSQLYDEAFDSRWE